MCERRRRFSIVCPPTQPDLCDALAGINFDFESPVGYKSAGADGYAALVEETAQAFHTSIPGSQVNTALFKPGAANGGCNPNHPSLDPSPDTPSVSPSGVNRCGLGPLWH